jgi:acyl-CoA thioester hydrolase
VYNDRHRQEVAVTEARPLIEKPAELATHPEVVAIPVQWGDQDSFGHVNNVVFFRWFETARVEYLHRAGLAHMMTGSGIGPILASITCNYRRQLNHPDAILVSASITHIGRSSLKMAHLVYSQAQGAIVAEGDSTIVCFDYASQRPTPVPADVRAKIEQMEGRKFEQGN